jgi:hypothetical protein
VAGRHLPMVDVPHRFDADFLVQSTMNEGTAGTY